MMPTLHTVQQQFQTALLQDQPAIPGLLSLRGDAQFGIYRHAYRARLRGALRENFGVLPLVMGDESFDALANAYIEVHPSQHYSLRWFGHGLADFMAERDDDLVAHPALVDLARLDWALCTAFDAASPPHWSPDALSSLPPERWQDLRFALHPSVQVLALQWAVAPVWHALKEGADDVPAPDALAHALLVWRDPGQHNQWQSLSTAQSLFVHGLQCGHSFGQLCWALADIAGEDGAPHTAAALLRGFLETGVVCGLHATPHDAIYP